MVGCDADEQLVRDCARICGLYPLPSCVRIVLPGGIAASGVSDSLCFEVQADAPGKLALGCAISETRRLLPFVTIESWTSPVFNASAVAIFASGTRGAALPHLSLSSPSTRVVVPFNRGIVANTTVSFLLHRL